MNESKPEPAAVNELRSKFISPERDAQWTGYVRRVSDRDELAIEALYDESSFIVYGIALRILANEADAEEVTLDVYSQVWRNASSFDASRGTVASWLGILSRSRAIDRLRSRHRNLTGEFIGPSGETSARSNSDPERATVQREEQQRIQSALARLPAEQQKVIQLAFYLGYTQSELAERLNEPLGTIKTRMRLGMMKLREHLALPPYSPETE